MTPAEIDAVVSDRVAAGEDLYHLDEQALADLDADVILTQDLCAVCAVDLERVDDALAYLGCAARVVTLDPSSLDDVIDSFRVVGDVLEAAEDVALPRRLVAPAARALTSSLRDAPPRAVARAGVDRSAVQRRSLGPDLVVAGGRRAVARRTGDRTRCAWDGGAAKRERRGGRRGRPARLPPAAFAELARQLVDTGRFPGGAQVLVVDADSHFVRPGPCLVEGAEIMARILHRTGWEPRDRTRPPGGHRRSARRPLRPRSRARRHGRGCVRRSR